MAAKRLSLLLPLVLLALFPGNSRGQTTTPPPDCIFFVNAVLTGGSPATISYPVNTVTGVVGFDNRTLGCQTWTFSYVATATSGTLTSLDFESATGAVTPGSYGSWGGTVDTGINPNTSSVQATSTFSTGCASMSECNVVDGWVKILLTRNNFVGHITGVLYGYRSGYSGSGGGGGGGSGCPDPCPVTQDTIPWQVSGASNVGSLASLPINTAFQGATGIVVPDWGFPSFATVSFNAGTDTVMVAGSAGTETFIGHLSFALDSPQTVTIRQGTGTNCGTNTAVLYGPVPGVVTLALDFDSKGGINTTVNGRDLCLHLGGAATAGGGIVYGTH